MINWGDDYWGSNDGARAKILKQLWGKTTAQMICYEIGDKFPPQPSRNAVIGKAKRLGLKRLKPAAHSGPLGIFPRRASPQP